MQPSDTHPFQRVDNESADGDVLSAGEAVLERAKAVARQISERVHQLASENGLQEKRRSE